ncbi:MAG: oligosaccharide flippase family protein [Flavobacteriales bacterium]|nr:oligosaccharide flippase family protein [Flavobacteriales bacterium]
MRRTFLLNLLLVMGLNLLVKPFYILGIDAEVQERVGADAYGGYAALLSLSFLLNILLDLGITNWNTRHIAQHTHLMRKHVAGILGLRVVLIALYAAVTLGAALVLGYGEGELGLLALLVLNQALAGTLLYLRSNIAGAQRFTQDSLLSVLDRLLLIVLMGAVLWGRVGGVPVSVELFALAQTAAYAVAVLVALVLVRARAGGLRFSWKPAFQWVILRQSLPYALLILLMTVYYRIDTVMLERMLPDGALQAGIYAQAFRFFEAINMLGFLMAGLLLPLFSRMLRAGQDVGPLTGLAFRLVWAAGLPLALIGMFHGSEVMALRYSAHTEVSGPAFGLLMGCFVFVGITYVFGTLLTAHGDLRRLNRVAAAGVLLNVGLNLVLIPRLQVAGAAWASLVTQALTALVQVALALQVTRIRISALQLASALLFTFGLVGAAWGMDLQRIALGWSASVLLMAALPWAMLTGLLRVDALHVARGAWRNGH